MWIGNYSKWFSCTTPTPDAPSALPTSIKSPCYIGCPKRGHGTPGIPSTCSKHSAISSHTDRFYSLSQGMLSAVISSMIQPEERSDRLLLLLLLYTYSFTGPLKLIGKRNWKQAGLCCPWLKKKEAPQLCSYDHRNQTAVPILPSLCNWKAQGESEVLNTFGQLLSNLHSKSLLDCTWTFPPDY